MKCLSISITWVVFVAYFSLLMGGVHGTVLCLGENGHIAIETAQNGSCTGFDPGFYLTDSPSQKPVISGLATQHCGPCVDVVLLTTHLYRMTMSVQQKSSPQQQKNFFSSTSHALFSAFPQRIVLSPAQFSKYCRATLLQTTVLLI